MWVLSFISISVLSGVTVTINQVNPLIEWEQIDNPLYPTCITGYVIADHLSGESTTVNSTTRSLTAQQIIEAGFPYCVSIRPTVTPITPMGPLQVESVQDEISIVDSGIGY